MRNQLLIDCMRSQSNTIKNLQKAEGNIVISCCHIDLSTCRIDDLWNFGIADGVIAVPRVLKEKLSHRISR